MCLTGTISRRLTRITTTRYEECLCRNLYLVAEALGLGVCAIGAFYDKEVNGMLGLDGVEETAVNMAAVGRPAREMP